MFFFTLDSPFRRLVVCRALLSCPKPDGEQVSRTLYMMNIVYIHDANILFEDAQGLTNVAYSVITEDGKPVSVCTYDNNGKSIIFDWELVEKPAREQIEKLLPKPEPHEYYAIVKHTRVDFCGETSIVAIASNYETAKKRFDEAVADEKARQVKFGYSYDTVEESETLYEAFDEGYEATDSISIIISKAPFIG